jgi:hypothetical protein
MNKNSVSGAVIRGILLLLTLAVSSHAQPAPPAPGFEYAAKIICGLQKDPRDMKLTRGFYATTINIHNPNEQTVTFIKKLALSYPPDGQRPGPVQVIGRDVLRPDEALKADCTDIQRRFFPNGFPNQYIEGFVVIQSPLSLDVTGVYTSANIGADGAVINQSGIDVEQIRERRRGTAQLADLVPVPGCERKGSNLLVTVRNQGAGPAGASTTRVDFGTSVQNAATPPIAPGATVQVSVPIPAGCFRPDCSFRVIVDAASVVPESDEANNTASSTCIG